MNTLANDVRYAFRQLRRAPGFALTAVLTLALGIGASSAIFCLIDGLWLHPMRVPHPGELVRIFATTQQSPAAEEGVDTYFNYSEYQTIAARTTALKGAYALGRRGSMIVAPRRHIGPVVDERGFQQFLRRPRRPSASGSHFYLIRRGAIAHPSRRAARLRLLAARICRRPEYRRTPALHSARGASSQPGGYLGRAASVLPRNR